MTNTVQTRDGRTVVAKEYKGAMMVKTFANRTQAAAQVERLKAKGGGAFVTVAWPFLVVLQSEAK